MSRFLAAAGIESSTDATWRNVLEWLGQGRKTASGENVTRASCMGLSAYFAAIRNISEDVGKIPFRVYRKTETGKEVANGDQVNALLSTAPNDEMGPMIFKQVVTMHALGAGNGYAEIVRDAAGRPIALYPIHPDNVQVMRDARTQAIVYKVRLDSAGQAGKVAVLPARDVIHIRGMGGDGLVGYSVAQVAAESMGEALATQKMSSSFFGNGMAIGGLLEVPMKLSKEARNRLIESWQARHQGAENSGKMALLEEGVKWQQTGVNMKDAQFIELRKFQTTDIARWFRIPPHKIGDLERATFSNIEHQAIEYVQDCLTSWIVRWEQEVDAKLLDGDPERFAKFAVQALMRGDSKTRSEYYRSQLNMGALSINEIRALEDMNGIGPDGDFYYMQTAMTTVERINEGEPAAGSAEDVIEDQEEGGNATGDQTDAMDTMDAADAEDMVDQMDAEARVARAGMMRPVIAAAIARCWAKESKATGRAMVKHKDDAAALARWWSAFRAEQVDYFVEALRPAVEATGAGRETLGQVRGYFLGVYSGRKPGQDIEPVAMQEDVVQIIGGNNAAE